MNTLLIDTSTSATVLGLDKSGDLLDRTMHTEKSHSREILPAIEQLIRDAGLTLDGLSLIVFGQGPGSFTGLRIAVGVVQGLGYGLNIPVVPVSSMAALAQSLSASSTDVFVGLTARLDEIYYGAYHFEQGVAVPVISEDVSDVDQLLHLPAGNWVGLGNCWRLQSRIESATGQQFATIHESVVPSVEALLQLGLAAYADGKAVPAIEATPVYLREKVADKPGEKR